MFSKFIHRPVLAIVISIVVVFLGLLAIRERPVSQFPEIAPPRVIVTIAYPGASADVLVKSTLIPLERSINGVQGMKYMVSDATSAGEATIQVVFDLDTDPNRAVVNVKNRVDQVLNRLPPLVQLEGVVVSRVQPSMLMYVNLFSTDEKADEKFLYNFANVNLLLAPFGLSYGSQQILQKQGGNTVPVTNWVTHPVTAGVQKVGVDNGYPVQGGTVLASEGGFDVHAAATPSEGHVLVWGDEWITYDSEWSGHPDYQVEHFWLNAIKWLTPAKECQVAVPPVR